MKLAKVVPIFKQGSRFTCRNYQPISVLSSISKIFEKSIFNQLMFYITNENMISSKQYGFRPGFTTSDCLIDLIEEITSSLDQGYYVVSLFLDLSKAFDTVNHQILNNKLKCLSTMDHNKVSTIGLSLSSVTENSRCMQMVLLLIHVLSPLVCLKDRC